MVSETSRGTVADYESRPQQFWEGTRHHDVSQNIDALIASIEDQGSAAPFRILDFGCGPGRDLAALRQRGHEPTGLDGSASFVEMAREYSGAEVWHQDFLQLELPREAFDGVFANASLFHVPTRELPRVLDDIHATLKPRGVLFASNPRGNNEEGWSRGRYCVYHDHEAWTRFLRAARFEEIRHYYRPPGLPRAQQPWLATLFRRSAHPA